MLLAEHLGFPIMKRQFATSRKQGASRRIAVHGRRACAHTDEVTFQFNTFTFQQHI